MNLLKKYFPFSFGPVDTKAFIITLVIYAIVGIVVGFLIGILAKLWLIGWIFGILGSLVDLYVLVGVVLTILSFTGLIK